MIERNHRLSVTRQCQLLSLPRSSVYHKAQPTPDSELELRRRLDELHLQFPWMGSRSLRDQLALQGLSVGRGRVRRLMQEIGIQAIYGKPRTTIPEKGHKDYPYLLGGLTIDRPNQVWAAEIIYIPMARGFVYLVAIMDWHSRRVLSWRLSNTMTADFCVEALEEDCRLTGRLKYSTPTRGQFTSSAFTDVLKTAGVAISMDGNGRWMDNVFIERLWRSVKYEEVYLAPTTPSRTPGSGWIATSRLQCPAHAPSARQAHA